MTTQYRPSLAYSVLDENGYEIHTRFDDNGGYEFNRMEHYVRNDSGVVTRTDFDDNMDGWIDRIAFDDDADGSVDRIEHYTRDVTGRAVRVRFDDDNDGSFDRVKHDQNRDGVLDLVEFYSLDADGNRTVAATYNLPLSYENKTGSPFSSIDIGRNAAPAFVDLDDDGDQDLLVGASRGVHYYKNGGSVTAPAYEKQTGSLDVNPFHGLVFGRYASPVFVDLDGDGDMDLVVGERNGAIDYYKNTGNAGTPIFEKQMGDANPFDDFDVGYYAAPAFADLDRDGDLDLAVGDSHGKIYYFENTSTGAMLEFEQKNDEANPFSDFRVGGNAAPVFADVDWDGDQDLVVGRRAGPLFYYENVGNSGPPIFEERTAAANPFQELVVETWSVPAFVDLGNGIMPDLVVGARGGNLTHHDLTQKNTYTRDGGGRITRVDFDEDGDGTVERVESYARDAEGNIARTDFDDNANDRADRSRFYDVADGAARREEHYTRDATGNLIRMEVDEDADGDRDWVEAYVLDDAGNRIGAVKYDLPLSYKTTAGALFASIDVGDNSAPAFADVNGDGDLDLVVGDTGGAISYYESASSATARSFTRMIREDNPFSGIALGANSVPAFADMDADGDQDLIVGRQTGSVRYYKNAGNALFEIQEGEDNPFSGISAGTLASPQLVDLDGDGDMDLVVGVNDGTIKYYRNSGSASEPVFASRAEEGAANPFSHISVGFKAAPAFTDRDGDGDWDLLVGRDGGDLWYYENTGSAMAPMFERREDGANPFNGIDVGSKSVPAFADLDGDQVPELIVGAQSGEIKYHGSAFSQIETYALDALGRAVRADLDTDADGTVDEAERYTLNVDGHRVITDVDSDADGSLDRVEVHFLDADGNRTESVIYVVPLSYEVVADEVLSAIDVGNAAVPAFADLNGDGDPDLLVGDDLGKLRYFENTGSAATPAFTQRLVAANPFDAIDVGYYAAPTFADLNGDGDPDLAVGDLLGKLRYFENTTDGAAMPAFTEKTGVANPFSNIDVGFHAASTFADLNGDGAPDLVVGDLSGRLHYFENTTGNAATPMFTQRENAANPFRNIDAGDNAAPTFADVDRDGDLDLAAGNRAGDIKYYENTGSVSAPVFTERTGSTGDNANPFDAVDAESRAAPTFADLNGDLMPELVSGKNAGELERYQPAPQRVETYGYGAVGRVTRTSIDEGADGNINKVRFDDDADGVDDRIERYAFNGAGETSAKEVEHFDNNGVAVKTEFDSNADGRVERIQYDNDADGTVDQVEHIIAWNVAGAATRVELDRDGDGTIDVVEFYKVDVNGVALQKMYRDFEEGRYPEDNYRADFPYKKIEFFDEMERQLATAVDTDADATLDSLNYSADLDVTSRILDDYVRDTMIAGVIATDGLSGLTRINLAGAGAGNTDLTISAEMLEDLADGDGGYQLRIDGDGDDKLRFNMDDFTEGENILMGGENYRQFTGTVGSIIVDPDIMLDDVRTVRTDEDLYGDGRIDRSRYYIDGDGYHDRLERYAYNLAGDVVQKTYWVPGADDPEKVEFFDGDGRRLAAAENTDDHYVMDRLDYNSEVDVVFELTAGMSGLVAGGIETGYLAGVPQINLAGAGAGNTDLTLSVEALAALANDNSSYQLRIDGDSNDKLRFDMDDFTAGAAVDVGGENYLQYRGTTGSFIVDPAVTLIDA